MHSEPFRPFRHKVCQVVRQHEVAFWPFAPNTCSVPPGGCASRLECIPFSNLQRTTVLYSYPPYFDDDPFKIYDRILDGKITWPKYTDPVAKYVPFAFE